MQLLADTWYLILIAAAAVWVMSALCWMLLPHHHKDQTKLPDEEAFNTAIRALNIPHGVYGFPHCEKHATKDPEFMKKWETGPVGQLKMWNPKISMGKNMFLTFLVYLAVSVLIAYVGSEALPRGASFARVFQVLGTVGVLAYSFAFIPSAIWFQERPRAIAAGVFDGVLFGLLTGAVFAAGWPGAAAGALTH